MLNYETLLSSYDDKLTLMQWLKKVEDALKGASAVGFSVNKKGSATISFKIDFEDGSSLESGDIVLQQGESVASARIDNGHLILTLTNGDDLDAGAIFSGNVTISGDLSVTGNIETDSMTPKTGSAITIDGNIDISDGNVSLNDGYVSTPILTSQNTEIEALKPVVEVMAGYSVEFPSTNLEITPVYIGAVKNGNKLTFAIALKFKKINATSSETFVYLNIPRVIGEKLFPFTIGSYDYLDLKDISLYTSSTPAGTLSTQFRKRTNQQLSFGSNNISSLPLDTEYFLRYEVTFLLSENLAA